MITAGITVVERLFTGWIDRGREDQRVAELRRALTAESRRVAELHELRVKDLERTSRHLLEIVLKRSPSIAVTRGKVHVQPGVDLGAEDLRQRLAIEVRARAREWAVEAKSKVAVESAGLPEPANALLVSPDDLIQPDDTVARPAEQSRSRQYIAEFHRRVEETERQGQRQ